MARLLADENFPLPTVLALRAAGLDILTAAEAGLLKASDPTVLGSAAALARTILTQDRDFIRLHKNGATHAGIIYTTQDDDFAALAVRVEGAIAGRADLSGQLIRVYRPRHT